MAVQTRADLEARTTRPLELLLACVVVIMIGYGVMLTVLPYYAERIHGLAGSDERLLAFHVGLLTSVYALAQLVTSPFLGRLADRVGRRPLLLLGLAVVGANQAFFGLVTSLTALYALRILGGIAAASVLVAATAYVADSTSDRDRSRGMAWFGTAVSLGLVAGPVLGGLLSRPGLSVRVEGIAVDGYSLPFFVAGLLALGIFLFAWRALPESMHPRRAVEPRSSKALDEGFPVVPRLGILLSLVTAAQFGLALFEGSFILYSQGRLASGWVSPKPVSLSWSVDQ